MFSFVLCAYVQLIAHYVESTSELAFIIIALISIGADLLMRIIQLVIIVFDYCKQRKRPHS
jgi:uncharacterized Tic20 family protein